MGKIDSYLPMDRRQVQGKSLPSTTNGAALFADISGFTRYSLNLEQELGSHLSAEELTNQLNQVYEALIKPVHEYRGSVISFGGDAIVCWFDGDNGRLATACALYMQEQMNDLGNQSKSIGDKPSLGLKIAVTSGRARRFLVGQLSGYIFAQKNRIGPWVMLPRCNTEQLLLTALALPYEGTISIVVPAVNQEAVILLRRYGFEQVRNNQRMCRCTENIPGQRQWIYAQTSLAVG